MLSNDTATWQRDVVLAASEQPGDDQHTKRSAEVQDAMEDLYARDARLLRGAAMLER